MSTEPEKSTERLPAEPGRAPDAPTEPVAPAAPASPTGPEATPAAAASGAAAPDTDTPAAAEPPPSTPPPPPPPPPPGRGYASPPPGQPGWRRLSPRSWIGLAVVALILVGCVCGAAGFAAGLVTGHVGDHRRHGPVYRDDRPNPGPPNRPYGPGWPGNPPPNQRKLPPSPRISPPAPTTPSAPTPTATA